MASTDPLRSWIIYIAVICSIIIINPNRLTRAATHRRHKPDIYDIVDPINNHSNWAVIIAGSNGYYNYRHQADVTHAYWNLRNLGHYPKENIIVFMYNDIVNNTQNPYPGQIFNEPGGFNFYQDIEIDYSGPQVTAANFLSVLKGEAPKDIPNGKVLNSTKNDNVFIFYSDHGATGMVSMPTGPPLYADDLIDTLEYMYNNEQFDHLLFYLEACESGSMFDGLLPDDEKIYASTASRPDQSSFACYYNDSLGTYMADEFSVSWLQDSTMDNPIVERLDLNVLSVESLKKQFEDVVMMVKQSNPQRYGEMDLEHKDLYTFQAYNRHPFEEIQKLQLGTDNNHANTAVDNLNDESLIVTDEAEIIFQFGDVKDLINEDLYYHIGISQELNRNYKSHPLSSVNSRNVKLVTLYHWLFSAITKGESIHGTVEEILLEIRTELKHRSRVDDFFHAFVQYLGADSSFMESYSAPRDFVCLKSGYAIYNNNCEPFSDYSLKYVQTIVHACETLNPVNVLHTLADLCHGYPSY